MAHRILAAATLMLVTTAASWADTEGMPNVKTPEPEKVEAQFEETLEDIQDYSIEQKNKAMQAARHGLDDLDREITRLQGDIDRQWRELSQEARLEKQEALSALKQRQEKLEDQYDALQSAGAENWERAKSRFQESWQSAQEGWQRLVAPITDNNATDSRSSQ